MMERASGGATAAVAAAAVAALLWRARCARSAAPDEARTQLSLRALAQSDVPAELRVSTYVDLDQASSRGYEHVAYLRACFDVSAVLDGLHAYTVDYLTRTIGSRKQSFAGTTQSFVQGVSGQALIEDGASFVPERLIGGAEAASGANPEPILYVSSGAKVQGGAFDLSAGSIYLGPGTTVEPGVLVRGPAVIGAGCVLRHGAVSADQRLEPGAGRPARLRPLTRPGHERRGSTSAATWCWAAAASSGASSRGCSRSTRPSLPAGRHVASAPDPAP